MKRILSFDTIAMTVVMLTVAASTSCTMKSQEAPPLTGPSIYGTGIVVAATPDAVTQDGASQSVITVTAFDSNGKPLRNLSLRTEIFFKGTRLDFGSLSARNIVTGADGRATFVYTAPASPSGPSVDNLSTVEIAVTPLGTDFANEVPRIATIRLVPPGIVVPADGLNAQFIVTPNSGVDNVPLTFDASASTSAAANPIARYTWDFGDGSSGSNMITTHAFSSAGTYQVTLTIWDALGRSKSTVVVVTIGAEILPTPSFSFSPLAPKPGDSVFFNASSSKAATGRTIRSYEWDFGDGAHKTTEAPVTSHDYTSEGEYRVILVVVDDAGRRSASTPVAVPVKIPKTTLK